MGKTCHFIFQRAIPLFYRPQLIFSVTVTCLLAWASCNRTEPGADPAKASATQQERAQRTLSREFRDYWYAGTAEVTSYDLEQARYGELRTGSAVLVFVTEPFNPESQVKADRPDSTSVSVLKLNRMRKFNTGIYPYSTMSSVFYPVGYTGHAIKLTTTVQEWCGHIFAQLNTHSDFDISAYSYFESEGDRHLSLPLTTLEDELWTQLRIDPEALPQGQHLVIPSFEYLRLKHQPFRAVQATMTLSDPGKQRTYTITYPELNRTLQIHFAGEAPFAIQGWTETYPDGFGADAPVLTSSGRVKRTLRTAYWQQNSNNDVHLRDSLGL